mmetsp:Transcript_4551/g.6919  ORF Transcript_4551/g.6919 Transcript_4551/m.6919 type:complete len:137 (-) Transcript_4551:142-552(-)
MNQAKSDPQLDLEIFRGGKIVRINKPGRAWLQLTPSRRADTGLPAGHDIRFLKMPAISIDGEKITFEDFVELFTPFSKDPCDFTWRGITICSVEIDIQKTEPPKGSLLGPIKVELDWEHGDATYKVCIQTSFGIIM